MSNLQALLKQYHEAIDGLADLKTTGNSSAGSNFTSRLVSALHIRDKLALNIAETLELLPEHMTEIEALDDHLNTILLHRQDDLSSMTLLDWRDPRLPLPGGWWWQPTTKGGIVWTVLAGLCLMIALSITGDIAQRFFANGPDFWSIFGALVQTTLAFAAGSTFTEAGRTWVEDLMKKGGIKSRFQPYWKAVLAGLTLAFSLLIRFSLPAIARQYNSVGTHSWQQGKLTSAVEAFQRAEKINPDFAVAFYNLGGVYEDLGQYDTAASEYRSAIKLDAQFTAAYINLAHLSLLRQKPEAYFDALRILEKAYAIFNKAHVLDTGHVFSTAERQELYSLHKNRAWAFYALNYLPEARNEVEQALTLRKDGPASLCLKAQILRASKVDSAQINTACEACVMQQGTEDDGEAAWLIECRRKVMAE